MYLKYKNDNLQKNNFYKINLICLKGINFYYSFMGICCHFRSFSGKLDFHIFSKYWIPTQTVLCHDCFIDLLEDNKSLSSHSVIFLTNNLQYLSISLKQKIQSVFEIFWLYFFVYVMNVKCLFWLLHNSLLLFDLALLLYFVFTDHFIYSDLMFK